MEKDKLSIIFSLLVLILWGPVYSQKKEKPPVDSGAYNSWSFVQNAVLSPDGRYASYTINNGIFKKQTLVVKSISSSWQKAIEGARELVFTSDSKTAIFKKDENGLCLLDLISGGTETINNVLSFKIINYGQEEWLAYLMNNNLKELVIRKNINGSPRFFEGVIEYLSMSNHEILLRCKATGVNEEVLDWLNLENGSRATIWKGSKASNIVLDNTGNLAAFMADEKVNDSMFKSLFYYKKGNERAIKIVSENEIDNGIHLGNIIRFSVDGEQIFFKYSYRNKIVATSGGAQVDVWSYTDPLLQSYQLKNVNSNAITAVVTISSNSIIQLERQNEIIRLGPYASENNDSILLLMKNSHRDVSEEWNKALQPSYAIVNSKTGETTEINIPGMGAANIQLSGTGKYLIISKKKEILCYEIATGIVCNLTASLDIPLAFEKEYDRDPLVPFLQPIRFLNHDSAFLFKDRYDIWIVNLSGKKKGINLTNGYGFKNHILFDVSGIKGNWEALEKKGRVLLTALSKNTKENGFYQAFIKDKPSDPVCLTMGPYVYEGHMLSIELSPIVSEPPLVNDSLNTYIVKRESSRESPNYFCTKDFKTFTALSDVHPERNYNWLYAELYTWNDDLGNIFQGILYKPENFDGKKKYPIIFYYYEKVSDGLNIFNRACPSFGNLNVTWFVSNGYLVFAPDIHFKIGHTGESAAHSVLSAAKYISQKKYVDAKRMGIQGISFGGYQTNYIVTHSNLFAAACSSSGWSDLISSYGNLRGGDKGNGYSAAGYWETGQGKMGFTLWEKRDLYIKNSPIFEADKIVTPLLLMHTINDNAVEFSQAIEFFTALRRLGKKSWMLQYDDGMHGVYGKSGNDFTIRMQQFFDHYLKDKPAPIWMTRGVPAKLKGIETGFEYDVEIKTPGESPLIRTGKK